MKPVFPTAPSRTTQTLFLLAAATLVGLLLARSSLQTAAATAAARTYDENLQLEVSLSAGDEPHLRVTIAAPDAPTQPAAGRDLALVLDRSGSMSGQKMACAKQATRALIESMGPTDRLALISYGTDVSVDLPVTRLNEAGRAAAMRALDHLYEDGGTNLAGGLVSAHRELLRARRAVREGSLLRRGQVVLLSDGEANEGVIAPAAIADIGRRVAADGISISTIGVGRDFDETVMGHLATVGRGRYYDVETVQSLETIFRSELDALSGPATALDVELYVTAEASLGAPPAGAGAVTAASDMLKQRHTIVYVGDIRAGEERHVNVNVRGLRGPVGEPLGALRDAHLSVRYRAPGADHQQVLGVRLSQK
ncbi:MAG: hypothetical protein Tsb0020_04750 [Haliangiales bacterium]